MNTTTKRLYQIINEITFSSSVPQAGNLLHEFVKSAANNNNRRKPITELYSRLMYSGRGIHLINQFFSAPEQEKRIKILDGKDAISNYLYRQFSLVSQDDAPLKILSRLEALATELTHDYIQSTTGPLIKIERVKSILDYMEKEYDFLQNIIPAGELMFISIIDVRHKVLDAVTSISIKDKKCINSDIYLFCTHNEKENNETPEAIFFHELSHMIFSRKTGLFTPSAKMITATKKSYDWLHDADDAQVAESIIDFLAVGLMYGSPFQKFSRLGEAMGDLECEKLKKTSDRLLSC